MDRIEAIKVIKDNWPEGRHQLSEALKTLIPELNESEDERIRKTFYEYFKERKDDGDVDETWYGISYDKILAWLEKRGMKANPYSGISFEYNGHIWGMCARDNGVDISLDSQFLKHFEMMGEQKPINKVEPKFKVGDWIVYFNHEVDLITGIDENGYMVNNDEYIVFNCEDDMRLWTIQDAKDGDVLVDSLPFIFNRTDNLQRSYAYCGISVDDGFKIESDGEFGEWTWAKDIKPSTKEQRDLLFHKMKEAGYEWDAEKKELRKIEQNPTDKLEPKFKVGDWILIDNPCKIISIDNYGNYLVRYWDFDVINKLHTLSKKFCESYFHLWTIQDAKDGDILANDKIVLIVDHIGDFEGESTIYSWYFADSKKFYGMGPQYPDKWSIEGFHPSTKEQRDQLFQKMKEAGYEWDVEKKELRKVEQNPIAYFKVGDRIYDKRDSYNRNVIREVGKDYYINAFGQKMDMAYTNANFEFLEHLEDDNIDSKPAAWSEEDEKHVNSLLERLKGLCRNEFATTRFAISDDEDWLKSLKERVGNFDDGYKVGFSAAKYNQWEPSDEQMKLLKEACDEHWEPDGVDPLYTLYQDLKKLKGE